MKFIHTADLHIGKTVNEFSMLAEQKNALNQIVEYAIKKEADAVVIAGDVYDRSIPPAEAVSVFDDFITELEKRDIALIIISGNHDSPERISFAQKILANRRVYISGTFSGTMEKIEFEDEYGKINFFLLPFVRTMSLKPYLTEEAESQNDAVKAIINSQNINPKERNVIVTHYFVTNSGHGLQMDEAYDDIIVGDVENVDACAFDEFDYTALGHIHGFSHIGEKNVYYSGSPIKYSFSEVKHEKGVCLVEMSKKGKVKVERLPIKPIHDMRMIKGKIADLMDEKIYKAADVNDYICATLTDKNDIYDAMGKLRSIYPNIMKIIIEKNEVDKESENKGVMGIKSKTPMQLYEEFYQLVTKDKLDEERKGIISDILQMSSEQ